MISKPLAPLPDPDMTPAEVRQLCRTNSLPHPNTAGYATAHAQANLVILPGHLASDFRLFCQRNPVPCPLLGETPVGDFRVPDALGKGADIRTDCAEYCVYRGGRLVATKRDCIDEWTDDSVAFFIGCSYSFEGALEREGLTVRHTELSRVTPCYTTNVALMPAGVFSGRMVVSMRPYPIAVLPQVRAVTAPYVHAHGEPVGWGPSAKETLGIDDPTGQNVQWGEPSEIREGEVPVYWGCGVTPQQVVLDSGLAGKLGDATVVTHRCGAMFVLDMKAEDVCERI